MSLAGFKQDVREIDQLIGTMLDYARLDHADLRMERQDTPLTEWLQQVVAKAQTQVRGCNITIHDISQQEYIDVAVATPAGTVSGSQSLRV